MNNVRAHALIALMTLALLAGACSTEPVAETTTTVAATTAPTTTQPPVPVTTTSSTTTLPPGGPPMIQQGDDNETVAAFQWLIACNGFADLTIDGDFGPGTLAAVQAMQEGLGKAVTGAPDEETFEQLSRTCSQDRRIEPDRGVTLVGNTAPLDPERYVVALELDSTLTVTLVDGAGAAVTVADASGLILEPVDPGVWSIRTTGDYIVQVEADLDPVTFVIDVDFAEGAPIEADWLITTTGISYQGTKLSLGDPAGSTIDKIYEFLGHRPRGSEDEFDTGWDLAGQEGFRGILIEGFRFLFVGPNAENPGRAETFERVRVVFPTVDGDGEPRPANYVTTPEGIGPGNTLVDLKAVYSDFVRKGGSTRHYYRLVNTGGEICFYFGDEGDPTPTDASVITEISTECRG